MSVIVDIVNAVVEFRDQVAAFLDHGIYDLLTKFTSWFIKWSTVGGMKFKLMMLEYSWDVAQELITSLNISGFLNNAYSSLESRTLNFLVFLRIPEAVNLVISAGFTKFVMKFLGF